MTQKILVNSKKKEESLTIRNNNDFYNEYFDTLDELKLNNGQDFTSYGKMAGNVFAIILIRMIRIILEKYNLPYDISINNTYIRNKKPEWDALIVKKGASDNNINVYNEEDVKCIIEFKTASFIFSNMSKYKNKDNERKRQLKEKFQATVSSKQIKNNNIRYLYITIYQTSKYSQILIDAINDMNNNNHKNSVFIFCKEEKYYYRKNKADDEMMFNYYKNNLDLEKFILNALK